MSSFMYFLREALVGFKRNLSTAIGSIVTIFLSLLIIGLFTVGGIMINNTVASIESEVTLTAYIADDAQESDIAALKSDLEANSTVKTVLFTTKDMALEKFKNSMSASPDVVDQLDGQNPLPASLDVELINPQEVEKLAQSIMEDPYFEKVCDNKSNPSESLKYGQKTIDKLFSLTNTIRIIGVILICLLIFIALIFINNTIRLAILARRREIAIMRLVGASNGFIRGPFFMESAIHSLIGSLCAVLVLEILRSFALPNLQNALAWMPLDLSIGTFLMIYLVLIIAGLIIGLIGSALAMRRYLKV